MHPGEIYMADLGGAGVRPVIVVSREALNRGNYLLVVGCTSADFQLRSQYPNCVPFHAGQFGFSKDCVAQCEAVFFIEKVQVDLSRGLVGQLDDASRRDVIRAIGHVIEADCEPV